jgi:hypothetical protein
LPNAQFIFRHLADALSNGPTVHWLEADDSKDQKVKGALNEIGGFAHPLPVSY